MTRILLAGLCPLPFENTEKSFGPGIRTWQFALPLAQAGHEVHLRAFKIDGTYSDEFPALDFEERDGVSIDRVTPTEFFDEAMTRAWIERHKPDAVVGATVYASSVLVQTQPRCPIWADQFGHFMAEAQAKASLEQADWPIDHFWSLLRPILYRADRFSVVSTPQKWAQVGELGLAGRLGHATCRYDFVSVIPCALIPPAPPEAGPPLKGRVVPEDAFVALWSGGYNVWSDVDTIFRGLELAMNREPRIHFVSTGGEIGGHDESTYARFQALIENSPLRDRFHLLGWLPATDARRIQEEADAGVLAEKPIYEGALGSKNRIVQWLGSNRLLAIYNRHGELGELLEGEELGLTFPVDCPDGLADCLVRASRNPDAMQRRIERAFEYTQRELTFSATTRELQEWADSPCHAPDHRPSANPDHAVRDRSLDVGLNSPSKQGWGLSAPGFPSF